MKKENVKEIIFQVVVPVFCAALGLFGGIVFTVNQNSKINTKIQNTLYGVSGDITINNNLEVNATNLIESYEGVKQENKNQKEEFDNLQNKYSEMQKDIAELEATNAALKIENEKLKTFLLHDNTYANDIEDLVFVKQTSDRLENLYIIDGQRYSYVDGVKDYYGNSHSVSYKLHADGTAFIEYKLERKYDTFNANIITTKETGAETLFNIEVYLDNSLVKRIDDITRATNSVPLGPIVVTDIDRLKIKVIKMQGNNLHPAICYITDDSLSIVQ